ncbi:hypothetical protein LNQ03_20795 [Klebsiella pneumoniae subsp. pneumoniae]|nr:hypothetical protein [Klebsiella pneumoniae subsp. pneumoniae]
MIARQRAPEQRPGALSDAWLLAALHALNIGAQRLQFIFDTLIAAIDA